VFRTSENAVLIVAHPGHEVLLHGWLERVRPRILILTDGSGRSGQPRINATRQYLGSLGLQPGSIFGRFSDLEIYEKILAQDFAFFAAVATEICETLLAEPLDYVVGDSAEGYNSVHDLCRMLINCAVGQAEKLADRPLTNFDYPVVGSFKESVPTNDYQTRWTIDPATFARKLAAAKKYYPELVAEVRSVIAGVRYSAESQSGKIANGASDLQADSGLEIFRCECFRAVPSKVDYRELVKPNPYYEKQGEKQAAAGFYQRVIRYTEHMLPIAASLSQDKAALKAISV